MQQFGSSKWMVRVRVNGAVDQGEVWTMENARNSFYLALRKQLSTVNPLRVTMLRGVQRAGILVEENETAVAISAPDLFVLRWTGLSVDEQHACPLATQECEVHYWTQGGSTLGGMDRGRLLSAMDAELVQMLMVRNAAKQNFSTTPPTALATRVFWSHAVFGPVVVLKNRLSRMVSVTVFSYEEAADL